MSPLSVKVAFLGAGRMASALAGGILRAQLLPASSVIAADPSDAARQAFEAATQAKSCRDNRDALRDADVVILAVKPQVLSGVLRDIGDHLSPQALVVSIAAGVTLTQLQSALPPAARVVRVMPNTPALIGQGASAYSLGRHATAEDGRLVHTLLETVGLARLVAEPLLDAVTGLSGSGPAYAYQAIEALSDGGVKMGLPRDLATELAAQTLLGAAAMVLATRRHPGALKDDVTSPGGTTIAGLHALEAAGFRNALISAVEAATRRAEELRQSE